jgi:glutathione synthase/RimK-type ligase-like ATP-grasp enzyme
MKKIGILFGQESSFPPAFVERVNLKTGGEKIRAEFVRIDKVVQGEPCGYDVVIDRISQDVPFYRAWLKNAAITGTAVVNNPFWWSADDKFFNNALATKIGVAVPKTVLLPSHQVPTDTNDASFRNLGYPLDWEGMFSYVGWPAFFKPFAGGGWKNVYRLNNSEEFFRAYGETGQLVMMLQVEVKLEMYFRCY